MATQEKFTLLSDWVDKHRPPETLFYASGYRDQILFVARAIPAILAKTDEEFEIINANIKVISEHTSKSVLLPVFRVELADGTAFTMRCNFYDWKVSVESPRDVEADFMGLFRSNERISEAYCEGFPENLVYGSYAENNRQFTIELPSSNNFLFTFFWIFAHKVLGKRNKD